MIIGFPQEFDHKKIHVAITVKVIRHDRAGVILRRWPGGFI